MASIGYLNCPVTWPERGIAALAALFLVAAISWTDMVGFGLAVVFVVMHAGLYRRVWPGTAA